MNAASEPPPQAAFDTSLKTWPQLVLETDPEGLPALEQALFDAGALSVTLSDNKDEPVLEPAPGEIRLWQSMRLSALFSGTEPPDSILSSLRDCLGAALPECRFEQLADTDWERSWMARFKAMQFGEHLWVCPSHVDPPRPEAINLRLDPGLAFGTGTHATTGLCLQWLARFAAGAVVPGDSGEGPGSASKANPPGSDATLQGQTVIDYGCGSGILAVAAAMLGAQRVIALDIDPQALIATRDNALRNQVESCVETMLPQDVQAAGADIILANILFAPLMQLAEEFCGLLKPGGVLVLSGILEEQVDALMLHYTHWFSFDQTSLLDGWAMLEARYEPEPVRPIR